MKQFTKEQAITFANEKLYENMTDEQISIFQLDQKFLCMPFDVFVRAISKVLGRSVYTHEFAKPEALKREMYGEIPTPTESQVINEFVSRFGTERSFVVGLGDSDPTTRTLPDCTG
jgi:hypothetical protein